MLTVVYATTTSQTFYHSLKLSKSVQVYLPIWLTHVTRLIRWTEIV